jgi:CRP/FNR family transcriptional regulator, cyclic AMP receptor protein
VGMRLDDLERLADIAWETAVPAGRTVIRQGEEGDRLYLIVEGTVHIHTSQQHLVTLGSGRYFGELSIIDGELRSASATTETDCLFLEIGREEFHELLLRHPQFAREVVLALTRDLRKARNATQ